MLWIVGLASASRVALDIIGCVVYRRALEEPPGAALVNPPIMTSKQNANKANDR
jgi:hypothetical protein